VTHGAAQLDGHDLLSVAEAKMGTPSEKILFVHVGRIVRIDRRWAAREDNRRWCHGRKLVGRDVTGDYLGVDVQVAHARNELAVLRAKVENCDKLIWTRLAHEIPHRIPAPISYLFGQNHTLAGAVFFVLHC